MPVYDYQCVCGHRQEAFRKIDDRHKSPNCEQCGGHMHQIIVNGFRDGMVGYPYTDPVLECVVESPRQKRELLQSLGLEQKC